MKSKKMVIIAIIMWILAVLGLIFLVTLIRNATNAFFDTRAATNQVDTNSNNDYSVDTKVASENSKDNSTVNEEEKGETITTEEEIDGPVSLFDCWTTVNDWEDFCSSDVDIVDNMGNTYAESRILNDLDDSITVKLDGKYSRLVINRMYLLADSKDTGSKFILTFYDENGRSLGASPVFKRESMPKSFEVDVTGVNFLKITKIIEDYSYWTSCYVGIDKALLYKE